MTIDEMRERVAQFHEMYSYSTPYYLNCVSADIFEQAEIWQREWAAAAKPDWLEPFLAVYREEPEGPEGWGAVTVDTMRDLMMEWSDKDANIIPALGRMAQDPEYRLKGLKALSKIADEAAFPWIETLVAQAETLSPEEAVELVSASVWYDGHGYPLLEQLRSRLPAEMTEAQTRIDYYLNTDSQKQD